MLMFTVELAGKLVIFPGICSRRDAAVLLTYAMLLPI
jgi:hypothetical protein